MKEKTVWFCTNCGNEYPKWMGRCPACGEWNTLTEQKITTSTGSAAARKGASGTVPGEGRAPRKLSEIDSSSEAHLSLNNEEVDRILGGGIVEGSLVLIGGEPGIGKSTLSLQIPLGCPTLKTLYVTGEESERQVKMRADRLGGDASNCTIYSETLIENIIAQARTLDPDLMIVDSVQTMYTESVDSTPGSVSQIKEVAAVLLRFAKATGIPTTKSGRKRKAQSLLWKAFFGK